MFDLTGCEVNKCEDSASYGLLQSSILWTSRWRTVQTRKLR